ncbi:MAG: hypothetical protein HC888_11885 [Candidatus Competibacteraceae bacterium]|nr:hypothetical protein [Candidatus Competibacteraceae bacterium]
MIVMASTMVSRLLGFLRIAVIGSVFGASGAADVLNAVFTIPNNLRKLMAEGALSSAFIPVLSRAIVAEDGQNRTRRIVGNILALQFIVLAPLLVLCVVFSGPLTHTLLDFSEAGRMRDAASLFQWIIHYLLLISVSAALMAVLNAHNKFVVPAITPILFSIFVIAAVVVFSRSLGIYAMAAGVLAGGVAQVLFQAPRFMRLGYTFKPDLRFTNEDFRAVMRLWLPVVATASIYSVNEQIAMRFATALDDGSASAMSNALVFWQLPSGFSRLP